MPIKKRSVAGKANVEKRWRQDALQQVRDVHARRVLFCHAHDVPAGTRSDAVATFENMGHASDAEETAAG